MKLSRKCLLIGMLLLISTPLAFGQCRVCTEWQGAWICITTNTRIKCLVDGDTCTMTLTNGCGASAAGAECRNSLQKGALREASLSRPGSRFFFVVGSLGDPLALKEISFQAQTNKLGIKDGKLLNNGRSAVVEYEFAAALVNKDTWKVSIVPGPVITSTVVIKPSEERGIIPMTVEDLVGQTDFAAIGLFVRRARFADGSVWEADLDGVKAEVEGAAVDVHVAGKGRS